MSNIDNLTSKILSDAKAAGEQIVSEAQEKADEKYEKSMKQVSQKKEKILESAKKEQVLLTDRIKSSANLKIRNEKLKAKQIVIDKVTCFPIAYNSFERVYSIFTLYMRNNHLSYKFKEIGGVIERDSGFLWDSNITLSIIDTYDNCRWYFPCFVEITHTTYGRL